MLIGYLVIYVNSESSVENMLFNGGIIYKNWQDALKQANIIAEEEMEKTIDDSCFIICLAKSSSQSMCDSNGRTLIYTIQSRKHGQIGEVFIVAAFEEQRA